MRLKFGTDKTTKMTYGESKFIHIPIFKLNLYLKSYQHKKWLFHCKNKNSHLTVRSVEKIFDNAVRSAGVTKDISIHSL